MKKTNLKNPFSPVMGPLLLLAAIFGCGGATAQLNPLAGIYFENQYLGNPAMAGIEQGMNLNMGYRQQWSSIPGTPVTQSITAEYGTSKKVGLGLNIYNDEAGLLKRTRVMGTYSYHLPLNDESRKLRFGISLGFMDDRVMSENISGEQNDSSIGKFNQRDTYIDGDFGLAYTSKKLTVQGAIPNLKSFLQKETVNGAADRSTFYSAISYKFYYLKTLDGFGVEPKLAIRGVQGFNNIVDAGANFTVANRAASVTAIYHSSNSATFGLGAVIKSFGAITANYTTATSALSQYASGSFQIGLKLDLRKKKVVKESISSGSDILDAP
jgi:type IX secretion system PorP/SprF family membrane protein